MSFSLACSVIVCSCNPRPDYLRRTLTALSEQTLPKSIWEILLIDNASRERLATAWDLSWHPFGRHVREEQLGLTSARLRGIAESTGAILVFVDDDNVLAPDYLETAVDLSRLHPYLGAFGGAAEGEFEVSPAPWLTPYRPWLALGAPKKAQWSNLMLVETTPLGAGLCVRREIANAYHTQVSKDARRLALDRKGQSLVSGGDIDLAYSAIDLGLGTGRFPELRLTHLIPAGRLDESYLLRLGEGIAYSNEILASLRARDQPSRGLKSRVADVLRYILMSPRSRRFQRAKSRGIRRAQREL